MFRIESLLSARLFLSPQIVGKRIFFISNLSGRLSLYAMDEGGSVPEPLLPPHLALQNPDLVGGKAFQVFPKLGKILVMLDQDGDENYQPMLIPIDGGFPEPAFGSTFRTSRVHLVDVMPDDNIAYLVAESREAPDNSTYQANLETGNLHEVAKSVYGKYPAAVSKDNRKIILIEGYSIGDETVYLWQGDGQASTVLYGTPLDQRQPGQQLPLTGIAAMEWLPDGDAVLALCAVFEDTYGPALLQTHPGAQFQQLQVAGAQHAGTGEMVGLRSLNDDRYAVEWNIDGCSWLYEASVDRAANVLRMETVLVGARAPLANGKLEAWDYDKTGDRYVLSFSTATSPTQIYTIQGAARQNVRMHTHERVLGIDEKLLAPGEDASFTSFDGTRVSARLYMPAPDLDFRGPRPVVFYIHGGPQSQERPDFAWFSMPLIQFLTLNGFAVFVPNARGSTGYGLNYTKQVDRDWGGQDRLDHVHAFTVLEQDPRLDVKRAGVVGRSYGGYMTLTLAARHPELWSAAVDMFGPYDLFTFMERIPETWKPYFALVLGDPQHDREFLSERSPRTHMAKITAPLLVIQGKNDPRVVERESHDLVEYLRGQGKQVDYLMFENEGHDVLKYENRVRCYLAITEFFQRYLQP